MGVDLAAYRARIGTFQYSVGADVVTIVCFVNFAGGFKTVGSVLFIGILLLIAGIESNPGPSKKHSDVKPKSSNSATIIVRGLPDNIDHDTLEMIFANKKKQGGGKVKSIIRNKQTKTAYVVFKKAKDQQSSESLVPICDTACSDDKELRSCSPILLARSFSQRKKKGKQSRKSDVVADNICPSATPRSDSKAVADYVFSSDILLDDEENAYTTRILVSGIPETSLEQLSSVLNKHIGRVKQIEVNTMDGTAIVELDKHKCFCF